MRGDAKANICFCDPPYNVDYAGGVGAEKAGKGRRIKNDALGDAFGQFLYDACVLINVHTNGAVYICMSSSELHTLQAAFSTAGGHWSTYLIWAKNRFTLGRSDYQRQYEPILCCCTRSTPMISNRRVSAWADGMFHKSGTK